MPIKGENIYKCKNGRCLKSYNPDGKGKYHSVYSASYTEVKEKLNGFKNQMLKSPVRSSKLAKYYVDRLGVVRLNYKESTYCKYRNVFEHHIPPEFSRLNFNLISEKIIESFLADKLGNQQFSPKTVNDILCMLKQIFSFAEANGLNILCNFSHIHIRQQDTEMRILSYDDEKTNVFDVVMLKMKVFSE